MSKSFAERLAVFSEPRYPDEKLGLVFSSIQATDGYDTSRLVHKSELFDSSLFSTSDARIADLLETGTSAAKDVIVGRSSDGRIMALGVVEVGFADGKVASAEISGEIHPDFRCRGIGKALLEWQTRRASELLLEVYGRDCELPIQISARVDGHLTDRRTLFEGSQFKKHRTFQVMYRDLTEGDPEVEFADGYAIIPWIPQLEAQVRALHLQAFADHWGNPSDAEQWWEHAMSAIERRWSYVAISPQGSIAGYISVARHPARWLRTGVSEAYVELLGVDPKHRGAGLARALITKTVKAGFDSKVERLGLDVDIDNPHGAHSFYERLGFEATGTYVIYSLEL